MEESDHSDNNSAQGRRTCPLVATNHDWESYGLTERGIDIIDDAGGMVSIRDSDLPRVIALLACHLAGEDVSFFVQESVAAWWDSDDLDDALAEVEQSLTALAARRDAIVKRIRAIKSQNVDGMLTPHLVEFVRLADLFRPELSKGIRPSGLASNAEPATSD